MSGLSGVIPAIPTPLQKNEDLDADALCRIIDHVIEQGASAVFVLGSMGEGPALLDSVKLEAVKTAVKHVNGRVPLMAGCSEVSTRRTIELGRKMQDLGPDHFVSTAPYYYGFPHQQCLIDYFEKVSTALDKPLWLYNNPAATGNSMSYETIETILNMDNVAGVKDTGSDLNTSMKILRNHADREARPFSYFFANEYLYDIILLMGADGIVTGGGTCFVDTLVQLYEAATEEDRLNALKLQQEFRTKMDNMLGPDLLVDWMAAVKTNLRDKGLCEDHCTHPFINRLQR